MRTLALLLLTAALCSPQSAIVIRRAPVATGGGGLTPPTFVSETETTAWNTALQKTTTSIATQSGDIMVACAVSEGNSSTLTVASTPSLTWSEQAIIDVANYAEVRIWTATAATTSYTATFDDSSSDVNHFGGSVFVFRASGGVGNPASTNTTGAPSLAITTATANSAIVACIGDWNATDGTTRTWRTVNSITPTVGNGGERFYANDSGRYSLFGAYWSDAGAAGSKTVGMTAPSGQQYSIVALEVKGQ